MENNLVKIVSNNVFIFFIFFTMPIYNCSVSYAKQMVYSLEETVHLVDRIVIGRIINIQHKLIGRDSAIFEVVKEIKYLEEKSSNKIKIKFGSFFLRFGCDKYHFIINDTYILFLTKQESTYQLFRGFLGSYHVEKNATIRYGGETISTNQFLEKINDALKHNREMGRK